MVLLPLYSQHRRLPRPRLFSGWFDRIVSALGILAFAILMLMVCGMIEIPALSLRDWHIALTSVGRR